MRRLRIIGNACAVLLTAGMGVTLILAGIGVLSVGSLWYELDRMPGFIFVIVAGAAFVLVAGRFVWAIVEEMQKAVLFSHQGDWGRIELSPTAVREFISDILRRQVGIDRFRIGLGHHADGVAITVRTALTPEQRVSDIGTRIQRELVQHVADRTGVEVREVSVLIRNIRGSTATRSDEEVASDAYDAEH